MVSAFHSSCMSSYMTALRNAVVKHTEEQWNKQSFSLDLFIFVSETL